MRKRLIALATVAVIGVAGLSACSNDADVVNKNLAKDADNFKIPRKTVAYNAITGDYIWVVEGYCSVDMSDPARYSVTCKVGNEYLKNLIGKSDNVTVFSEQLTTAAVSPDHYKVVFKPSVVIPSVEMR